MADLGLARVLAETHSILLDFDGPVTPLFPNSSGLVLANQVRRVLLAAGLELTPALMESTDHLSLLRYGASAARADTLEALEDTCLRGEVEAAKRSKPTAGAHATLHAALESSRPVAIVSNNAEDAVSTYIARHGLGGQVLAVIGRLRGRPDLMKPNVDPVNRALRVLGVSPESCSFIGDSVTDVDVSRKAHVYSIGYAKSPERGRDLRAAGADAIVDDMRSIATLINATG